MIFMGESGNNIPNVMIGKECDISYIGYIVTIIFSNGDKYKTSSVREIKHEGQNIFVYSKRNVYMFSKNKKKRGKNEIFKYTDL